MTYKKCICKCEELYIQQQRNYLYERIFDSVLIGTILGLAIVTAIF